MAYGKREARVKAASSCLVAALAGGLVACGAADDGGGDAAPIQPVAAATAGVAGGIVPATPNGGVGGSGLTGSAGSAGAAGAPLGGVGGDGLGMAGAAGMAPAGSGGAAGGGPVMGGVDPSAITLTAVSANQTVGLDWPRIAGATGYRVYWSMTAGVTPMSGQAIDVVEPGYVHRALTNGSAYYYVITSLLASGEGPLSTEATATPGGDWTLEVLGAGDFVDVSTGERVPQVPLAQRIHVLLLAEGYLEGELGIFHDHAQHNLDDPENDVDRWLAEVFAIDPYSQLREAFVVWYYAKPSSAHIDQGETAFGNDPSTVGETLFPALDGEGTDAFPFPLTTTTKNYVASFLLFDPARGRAGVSGYASQCSNPEDSQQRIGCAFGVGHAHEFTHAFAGVRDEYMENDNNLPQESETSNIYPTNTCDALPWAHLLEGRGINDTADLVGAFGHAERGYHSELLCLMNGTHDNGQYWCASGDEAYTSLTLRPSRLCNYCRELTGYHVMRRSGLLPEMNGFETWKAMYRMPFYDTFGFAVPEGTLPQTLECNRGEAKAVYEACVP